MTTAERLRAAANANMSLAGYEMDEAAAELDQRDDTIAQLRAERDALARERDQLKTGLKEAGKQLIKAADEFRRLGTECADLKAKLAQVEATAQRRLELLRRCEWGMEPGAICRFCRRQRLSRHAPDCPLAKEIQSE